MTASPPETCVISRARTGLKFQPALRDHDDGCMMTGLGDLDTKGVPAAVLDARRGFEPPASEPVM